MSAAHAQCFVVALLAALFLPSSAAFAEPVLFLSTQLAPIPEATAMRDLILKDFPNPVEFDPYDDRDVYAARVLALLSRAGGTTVLGGLQDDFLGLYRRGALEDIRTAASKLTERTFLPRFAGRGAFGADGTYFIPWMHATYLMAANKRALRYLPKGANLKRLSYEELLEWAAALRQATGAERLGFPAGSKGLMVRFLQGYLYPSFTGSMTEDFSGPEALAMWQYFRDLWQYVDRSSVTTNRMDRALLNGDVWLAWDHCARLLQAFKERPDQFVAFPAPVGPKGRGMLSVLAGLGVPRGSGSRASEELIEYLTRPGVQARTMESVGFMPVVDVGGSSEISRGSGILIRAAMDQLGSPEAIFSTVPLREANAARGFNLAYLVAFSQIVLRGFSIQVVLEKQERFLRGVLSNDHPLLSENAGH